MIEQTYNLMVILGATAGGKTALAVQTARKFGAEIISADSRQVYRGMDLGTGKDLEEYGDVPYHLIDIAEPGSEYNVFQFQRDCFGAIDDIWKRQRVPLICGGTGLYLDAVVRGYRLVEVPENEDLRAQLADVSDAEIRDRLLTLKPDQHNRTDLEQRERIIRALEIAVGEQSAEKICHRYHQSVHWSLALNGRARFCVSGLPGACSSVLIWAWSKRFSTCVIVASPGKDLNSMAWNIA